MSELPRIKILLVDDRRENLITLGAVLDHPSYELIFAYSGAEALRQLLNHDFALILLDVHMPIMDGFETAKFIRDREKSKDIPIIFLSAINRDEPFIFQGYGAGAVDYILKPFDPTILRSKVAVFAELHRKNIALRAQTDRILKAERIEQERKLMELEIHHLRREQWTQQKYRNLVERIPNGVVWAANATNLTFSFTSPNAEQFFACPQGAWENNPGFWFELQHPEDRERVRDTFFRGKEKKSDFSIEHRVIRQNGDLLWLQTGVRWVEGDSPEKNEFQGLSIDISRIKASEESARTALRSRDEFLSIASHELKTPLTALKLYIQTLGLLRKKGAPTHVLAERMDQGVGVAGRQVERLCRLINELLDVSRIENGKFQLAKAEVKLSDLIQEVIAHFSSEAPAQKISVQLDSEKNLVGWWDPLRIEQIMNNLLGNALKYGRGNPILVRTEYSEGMAKISVIDQGDGIAPEDQSRIFQRFERAASDRNFGGLGLGLYIAKNIVTAHGGSIEVASQLGKGSTFTVSLPAREEEVTLKRVAYH
jgi:PAS domain S-box-containing protein